MLVLVHGVGTRAHCGGRRFPEGGCCTPAMCIVHRPQRVRREVSLLFLLTSGNFAARVTLADISHKKAGIIVLPAASSGASACVHTPASIAWQPPTPRTSLVADSLGLPHYVDMCMKTWSAVTT